MKVLLLSNSTNQDGTFLEHAEENIKNVLKGVEKILFIPFAAIKISFEEYEKKVQEKFLEFGIEVESLHRYRDGKKVVREAQAVVVGGGNTFRLLKMIQQYEIIETLRYRVLDGMPYIGWSAGANVACPTICTTNDMPIAEPENFNAFNLVRFQINPHYTEDTLPNHTGESRVDRLSEFCVLDPYSYVVGLREGSSLLIEDGGIQLLGKNPVKIYKNNLQPWDVYPDDDLDFLFD